MKHKETEKEKNIRLIGLMENTDFQGTFEDNFGGDDHDRVPVSKVKLKSKLYRALDPLTKSIFKDDSWYAVKQVKNAIGDICNEYGADFVITGSNYVNTGESNASKKWTFSIDFLNNKNIDDKILGIITAHGAGSVQDPLDRYDITVTM